MPKAYGLWALGKGFQFPGLSTNTVRRILLTLSRHSKNSFLRNILDNINMSRFCVYAVNYLAEIMYSVKKAGLGIRAGGRLGQGYGNMSISIKYSGADDLYI